MEIYTIRRERLEYKLRKLSKKGKLFTVEFTKQNGEVRELTGIVTKPNQIERWENTYITVFDVFSDKFRMINLETAHSVVFNNKYYRVD